jgi:hypothetical protein
MHKTAQALHDRDNQKKNDRALLFGGEAQVLSSDEFVAKLRAQVEQKKAESMQKVKNAELRSAQKEAQTALEEEWLRLKAEHEANIETWKATCVQLTEQNVPKKNFPKKPQKP